MPLRIPWLLMVLAVGVVLPSASTAQDIVQQRIEIPSSPNPVGSGARALGMGGAFIAVADDATAASWNPAGLVQLERPEVSLVGAYVARRQENTFTLTPEADGTENVTDPGVNYLSAVLPLNVLGHNAALALTYQNLYDFTAEGGFSLFQESDGFTANQDIRFRQSGDLSALGLSGAVQVLPTFSAGLTLNIWDDGLYENGWRTSSRSAGTGTVAGRPFTVESSLRDEFSFEGVNVVLGCLWQAGPSLSVGAVYKSGFSANLAHTSLFEQKISFAGADGPPAPERTTTRTGEDLQMPPSYGLGVAYRHSDRLTISADLYRTEWGELILTNADGVDLSPVTGEAPGDADISATTQVRFGGEYLIVAPRYVLPLRAGVFYDPAPAKGNPDDFYGLTLGAGYVTERFSLDASYQYRFGNGAGESILQNLGFSQDTAEHTLYTSLIVYF